MKRVPRDFRVEHLVAPEKDRVATRNWLRSSTAEEAHALGVSSPRPATYPILREPRLTPSRFLASVLAS